MEQKILFFASIFYNKLAIVLILVSLINLITTTLSIGLLFIYQILKSKKMSAPQVFVIYKIEPSNIWLFLAI